MHICTHVYYVMVILVTGDGYEMDYISWGKKVKGGLFVIMLEEMVGMDGLKLLPIRKCD